MLQMSSRVCVCGGGCGGGGGVESQISPLRDPRSITVRFSSACPAREERDNFINHVNGRVALTGSALLGEVGPFMGSVDIAESEDAYVFRVSLPGVARDESKFYV
ncbi:hypothetical protein FXO38_31819 [Capsicum annuum]|nr:hypothetical protein FXO38_31819 [Capsicum annuum]